MEKLNSLAIKARSGDADSLWQIKSMFLGFIHALSEENRNRLPSQAEFEEECFSIIDETVRYYNEAQGNFSQLLVRSIKRRLGRSKERWREKTRRVEIVPIRQSSFEEDEVFSQADVKDDLAVVDASRIIVKEKIAFLAEGDPLKVAILNAWVSGELNNSAISVLLAQNFGGKAESHRRQITRFRSQCQKALATAS